MVERRLGLALSGGGFRAAFFHLGVLARLAELDRLREIHAISTVSGGSIIGVAYYLRLKRLLEEKPDAAIGQEDYVEAVNDVGERFRAAVARNIRARVLLNPVKNLLMLAPSYSRDGRSYSRTDRVGGLLDRYLYRDLYERSTTGSPGPPHGERPPSARRRIELRELLIRPCPGPDEPDPGAVPFVPDEGNRHRTNKVPILIINATALNTGHGWRFEAVRMGEHHSEEAGPTGIRAGQIDKNHRLLPGYFDQPSPYGWKDREGKRRRAPDRVQDFPLAYAVAASAAVPVLFKPLAIAGMYEGARVQLVDGGVHDNQGVQTLVDRDCTELIVSDGSAQMDDKAKPSGLAPAVATRSLSIFADRVREQQLLHAHPLEHHGEPDVRVMHLRMGLPAERVQPGGPWPQREGESEDRATELLSFGVHRDNQDALSRIRTDLDLFTESTSTALAADGYLIAGELLGEPEHPRNWWFSPAIELLGLPPALGFGRHLEAGRHRFLRPLALAGWSARALKLAGFAVVLALLALAVWSWEPIGEWLDASVGTWVLRAAAALVGAALAASLLSLLMLASGSILRRLGRLPARGDGSSG